MDDNPWGNPTPTDSEQATPAPISPVVVSTDDADEVPAWSGEPTETQAGDEPAAPHEEDKEEADGEVKNDYDGFEPMTAEANADEDEAKEAVEAEAPAHDHDEPHPDPSLGLDYNEAEAEPETPLSVTTTPTEDQADAEAVADPIDVEDEPASLAAVANASELADEPTPAPAAADDEGFGDDNGFGDDDDFGEMGGEGAGDDDFGDFGDFDESAGAFEEAQFDPPPPPPAPISAPAPPPVASTSGLPPLRLDWSKPTRKALGPQLNEWFEQIYPGAADSMTDEQERQVDGVGQVLVTEPQRGMLTRLSSLPPLRPLDWRRSKARREHLIALGVPVNLDDSAALPPLGSLVISPPSRSSTPGANSRAFSSAPPVSASPLPFSSASAVPSRSATPQGLDRYLPHSPDPPPLNKARAEDLIGVPEQDLELMAVGELERMRDELDQLSVDASEVLTHALLMREKETGDGETYHGMIQDLVTAAAKMKTAGGKGPPARAGSGSSRWSRAIAK